MVDDILVHLLPQLLHLLPEFVSRRRMAWEVMGVFDRPHVLNRIQVWGGWWMELGWDLGNWGQSTVYNEFSGV